MKTIYVITEVMVGGMEFDGEPRTLAALESLQDAIEFFEETIADSQPSECEKFEEDKYIREDGCIIYELTNFDEDYLCWIKLQKVELE